METRFTSYYTTCLLVFIAALTSWVCVGAPVEGSPDMRILHKHVGDTVHVPCNWVDNAKTARWQYRNDSVLGAEFRPVATHFIREDSTVWSESYFDGKADVENLTLIVGSFRAEMVGQYRCVIDGNADNTRITALRLALPPVDNTTTDNPPNVVTPIIVVIAILLLIVVIALLVWKRNELIEWWNTRRSPVNHIPAPPGDTDPATRQKQQKKPNLQTVFKMPGSSGAQDAEKFEKVFYELVDDLTGDDAANPEIVDAAIRFKEVLVYNVPGGKRNRGLTVVNAFRQLASAVQCSEENVHIAMVLGWCVEWLQAYFLIADDMMDQSKTRRGQPCWYKKEGVGSVAINDSFYVEACIYKLLKKHIRHQPYYVDVMDLFHETTYQTVVGQALDLITSPDSDRDLNRFNQQRYAAIVKWKTAFYSFYLPVALAMYMVGISDAKAHSNAKTILLQMGHFFQVQDDYLDCYGDPEVIGKIGTDIEENKCGWLVVQALERVTPEQRKILEENYGVDDADKAAKIKELYQELDLQKVYREYEESSYNDLMNTIDSYSQTLPKDIFVAFAKRIYKRNK